MTLLADDPLALGPAPPWASPSLLLFSTPLVRIGAFRADPSHPLFRDSGPIDEPTFVFPRTSVRIQHADRRPFVTDANVVTYYNAGQVFRRDPVDPAGDRCEWFALREDVLVDVLRELDPSVDDRRERPFPFMVGPGDCGCYLRQRALVHHVRLQGRAADALAVEETVIELLAGVAGRAYRASAAHGSVPARYRDLAQRLKILLARNFNEDRRLDELAAALRCSPFYLARVFRAAEGTSIHRYRIRLRLVRSLEPLALGRDIRAVAAELGFASHSHFTAAFRRAFGVTPSSFRRHATGGLVRELIARFDEPTRA